MNRFRFEAFLKEFPCLALSLRKGHWEEGQTFSPRDGQISIKRMDANLLRHMPKGGDSSYMYSSSEGERVDFVLSDGTYMRSAVTADWYSQGYRHRQHTTGETVLEAIYRHGVADRLAYIISVHESDSDNPEDGGWSWSATLYKPAKGNLIADMIRQAEASAVRAVQNEANF